MTTAEAIEAVRVARSELDRLTALLSGGLPIETAPKVAASVAAAGEAYADAVRTLKAVSGDDFPKAMIAALGESQPH